jgi:hypothetical protein
LAAVHYRFKTKRLYVPMTFPLLEIDLEIGSRKSRHFSKPLLEQFSQSVLFLALGSRYVAGDFNQLELPNLSIR